MKECLWMLLLAALFVQEVWSIDTLQQVIIVTRHGVRAPTWETERLNQYSAEPWPDFGVKPAELTPHGRALMKIMGAYYRDLYSKSGLIGGPGCADVEHINFWADVDQRTVETARAMAETMLPGCEANIRYNAPDASDALYNAVEAGVAKPDPQLSLAAINGRVGPQLDALLSAYRPEFDRLQSLLRGEGKPAKSIFDEPFALKVENGEITMTGPLRLASTLTQNLLLEYANGFSGEQFGWGRLTPNDLESLLALHTAYAELMRRAPYMAQARGSNLLSRIVETMRQTATRRKVKGALGTNETRLVVLSGHDTNLSNLSGMLGLSWIIPSYQTNDVPPGGALVFTLWRSSGGKYSVRTQFVAQTLTQMHDATALTVDNPPITANLFVPGCSTARDGYPCDWRKFYRVARWAIEPTFVDKKPVN